MVKKEEKQGKHGEEGGMREKYFKLCRRHSEVPKVIKVSDLRSKHEILHVGCLESLVLQTNVKI